jgi:hypothetical protein
MYLMLLHLMPWCNRTQLAMAPLSGREKLTQRSIDSITFASASHAS